MNIKLVHFLILILLVSSSYDCLPSLVSVEARKLTSNAVFELDLIHRDSLYSPYYNPYMTHLERQKRVVSRGRHIQQVNDAMETDIIPNHGEYLMKLAIGSPPVEYTAIADTGSDLIWLQCAPCNHCVPQPTALFDPTKSSTYQAIPCTSQSCSYSSLLTGCSINDTNQTGPCLYVQGYGDGTNTSGILSTDTITFPSVALPSLTFGCGYDQYAKNSISGEGLGVVGLGGGPLSLVSQLGLKINYKFSYCLAPLNASGLGATSKMRFGADVIGPKVVSTPLIIRDDDPTSYFLKLDRISIGNTTSAVIPVGQNALIDSGTTLTTLERNVYNRVRDAVTMAIGLRPVPDPDGMLDLCFETETFAKVNHPPDVVFEFDGADVVLKAPNTFLDLGNVTCLTIIPKKGGNIMTFGNFAQFNFEVGYDLQAKVVSFAPRDCANY